MLAAYGEEHLRRLRRETQVASRLEYPRIARVYELSEAHGVPYLAMEYIEGDSLEGLQLPPLEAAAAILDAARVIQAAHDRGIVHRDLKPGNLLRRDGKIFVVDFGLAKPLAWEDSVSADGRILGTLPYMSPEQAQGRVVGPASDVYALGATLYRLATGRVPVRAASAMELLARLARRDIPPPRRINPAIPIELEAVILKAMEEEPARYPSAAALADDLERLLRGAPVSARPSCFAAAVSRAMRRHPRTIWAVALLLALFVGMALFGTSNSARVAELIESSDRHAAEGRYEEALADLNKAVALAGDRPELETRRAHAEERLRARAVAQIDLANRRLEGARALLEEARLNLYRKGAVFSERFFAGLESALAQARESAAIRETSTARYLIGAILHLRGDLDEALAEYARALELEPGHAAARIAKARAYVDQGVEALFGGGGGGEPDSVWHFESARRVFEETPDLARGAIEGEIESQLAWAWNLVAGRRLEEAVRYASERAEASEEFVVVQGIALARNNQPREAIRVLAAAIERRPNYYQAFFFRGALTAPLNVEFALREFDQALAIHPRYLPCLLARAELRFQSGRRDEAIQDWTAAIRIRPALPSDLSAKIASARGE